MCGRLNPDMLPIPATPKAREIKEDKMDNVSEYANKNGVIAESGCSDGWSSHKDEVNGECPDCGYPTVNGDAASGCNWSPIACNTCGHRPCDLSC